MLAQIIVHPNPLKRLEYIESFLKTHGFSNPHPDLLFFDDASKLGVEETKKIVSHLSFKPYKAKNKAIAIISSQNLSNTAQNSLLKTLEEPSNEALILLGVDSESALLPTILSRCQVQILDSETGDKSEFDKEKVEQLINGNLVERFKIIETTDDREGLFEDLVSYYRDNLKSNPQNLAFSKLLVEALEWKGANVNIRGILEYLMFYIPN